MHDINHIMFKQFPQVKFAQKVYPTAINIYETLHAGGIVALKGKTDNGYWRTFWSTPTPKHIEHSRIFSPPIQVVSINLILRIKIIH